MAKFEISSNDKGQYHFVLKAGNGEIIATSQMYKSLDGAKKGIESVKANAANADVVMVEKD